MPTVTAEQRRQFAASGAAMEDGSFYIRNRTDLHNAILAVGRATPNAGESETARRNAVRRHCIKRARALGLMDMIPDTWNSDGTLKQSSFDPNEEWLAAFEGEILKHYGVLGMRWGVRRERPGAGQPQSADSARAQALRTQIRRSGTSSLSNQELQVVITRLQLEGAYKNLDPTLVQSGQKFAKEVLRDSGKQIATQFIVRNAPKGADKLAKAAGKAMTKKAAEITANTPEGIATRIANASPDEVRRMNEDALRRIKRRERGY